MQYEMKTHASGFNHAGSEQKCRLYLGDPYYRDDICLQTLLLLFKCANHRNKRAFASTANEALVGTLMKIGL